MQKNPSVFSLSHYFFLPTKKKIVNLSHLGFSLTQQNCHLTTRFPLKCVKKGVSPYLAQTKQKPQKLQTLTSFNKINPKWEAKDVKN